MGKYIKLFENHTQYETFIGGGGDTPFVKPNVSHCIQENEVHYNPYDYSDRYLTFIAREDGATFTFNGTTVNEVTNKASYSIDNGETWTEIASGVSTPSIDSGDRILWKGEMTPNSSNYEGIGTFTSTKTFDIEGNAMSLLFGDDFGDKTSLDGKVMAFLRLFGGNTNVVSAKNLSLPATSLAERCYQGMFNGCTSLTQAPELPATTLAQGCYSVMFYNCASLTTAPELSATTLADSCYIYMFQRCTSLTTAPQLPAATLANSCYYGMFMSCTSLTTAPELPATALAEQCYSYMFQDCTSLTTAPELPATTLASRCYSQMFQRCTSLTTAPELPAATLADECYDEMFAGCTNLTSAPELPATTLADNCYNYMFRGCAGLTTAPELPATTLADGCYYGMFMSCTSLTTAPELPATALAEYCYYQMFDGCTNLNYIKAMFTTLPSWSYTSNWVNGVSATGTFVKNSAATWNEIGVNGVPTGWTIQTASE